MFRPLRRKNQELSKEECEKLLTTVKRATLAVNGDDGYPYALPINFLYDETDGKIYFHMARAGHKADAMARDDRVCLTLRDEGEKSEDWSYYVKSVVLFGRAKPVEDEKIAFEKAKKFGLKYYPDEASVDVELQKDFSRVRIMSITIEHLTGKRVHEK